MASQVVVPTAAPVRERQIRRSPRRSALPRIRSGYLHPMAVNMITQVRPAYNQESIEELAESIAAIGMLQVPMVAELTPDKVDEYLAFFNRALGADHTKADLVPDINTGHYFVVVFGHRRTKANRILCTDGCSSCQLRPRGRRPKSCVEHHDTLDQQGMEFRIYRNIDPVLALDMQITENTSEALTREANAESLRTRWEIAQRLEPTLTRSAFAKKLNQSPAVVTDALAFTLLPEAVKKACRNKLLPFTGGVELARLTAAGYSEEEVIRHMMYVKKEGKRAPEIRAYVTGQLEMRSQVTPDDLMLIEEVDHAGLGEVIAEAARRQALNAAQSRVKLLRATREAIEKGMLPMAGSIISHEVTQAMNLGDRLEALLVE